MICSAHPRAADGRIVSRGRSALAKQRGMTVLLVSCVMLMLITMATFYTNKGAVMEQRISNNQYSYTQAFEAAQGELNYALAWLGTTANINSAAWIATPGAAGAAWVADATYPPYNQQNTTSIAAQTIGNFAVSVTLWRNSTNTKIIEIVSTSTGASTGTVKQIVNLLNLTFNVPSLPPLVVNGCVSDVTGTPSINGPLPASGNAITTSQPAGCVDPGNFDLSGGTVAYDGFSGTAWDYTFGISKADMYQLASSQAGGAQAGPGIYYYNDANPPPSPWHLDLGDANHSVLLIFDLSTDCPKINGGGGVTIYGIVYCNQGLDMQGWGNAHIYGSVITDSSITKFTANTELYGNSNATNSSTYDTAPVVSKIAGSWRDF